MTVTRHASLSYIPHLWEVLFETLCLSISLTPPLSSDVTLSSHFGLHSRQDALMGVSATFQSFFFLLTLGCASGNLPACPHSIFSACHRIPSSTWGSTHRRGFTAREGRRVLSPLPRGWSNLEAPNSLFRPSSF